MDRKASYERAKQTGQYVGGRDITKSAATHEITGMAPIPPGDEWTHPAYMTARTGNLFGEEEKPTEYESRSMTPAEITRHYPEAIRPRENEAGNREPVPYNLSAAPLAKGLRTEDEKVNAYADRLVSEARSQEHTEPYQAGAKWYEEFVPKLKKWFGDNSQMFAELLSATSPQTKVRDNFQYAKAAFEGWQRGEYDAPVKKFNEGLQKAESGTLQKWYEDTVPKDEQKENPSPEQLMAEWVDRNDLIPVRWDRYNSDGELNGTKFGMHGDRVMKVLARKWIDQSQKVRQFLGNLTGVDHGATIDVWAARLLRRMGYDVGGKRWRILPSMETAVNDSDFDFGQKVFTKAAEKMGLKPDVLQGAMWFAEKKYWADRGWGRKLDYGDFRHEIENYIKQRQISTVRGGTVMPLDIVHQLGKRPSLPISDIKPAQQARMNLQFMTAREREEFPPAGIKTMPAIQIPGGKIFTGAFHPAAYEKAKEDNPNLNFRDVKTGWAGTDGGFYAYSRPPLSAGDIQPFRPGKLNNDMRPDLLGKNSGEAAPLPIVRHGEIENNEKKLTRGWIPAPLTKKGEAQAADAAKHLEGMGVDRIETSDLKRARQTADIIGGKLDVPVTENSGLRPWGLGPKLEGVDAKEQQHIFKELVENPDKRPPGKYPDGTLPETFNEFRHRIFSTIEKIQAENPDGGTAIVTHYRVMHALETRTKGHEIDPKAFVELGHDNPGGVSVLENGKLNHVS